MIRSVRPAISHRPAVGLRPGEPATMAEALVRAAAGHPGNGLTVIGDGETRWTYPELYDAACRVLAGLRAAGLRPGDRVVCVAPPAAPFFPAWWGCLLGGVVPTVVARPMLWEAGDPGFEKLRHAYGVLGAPPVIGDVPRGVCPEWTVLDPAALLDHAPAEPDHRPEPGDTAMFQLSSGSTAAPKVIPLTHRGLVELAVGVREDLGVTAESRLLNWMPLDHSAGILLYPVAGLWLGADVVHAHTDTILGAPERWLDLLSGRGITHAWAPNFAYRVFADAVANAPHPQWTFDRLESLVSGGEQITLDAMEAFFAATATYGLRREVFTPAWGMAETTTGICFAPMLPERVHRLDRTSLAGAVRRSEAPDAAVFLSVGPPCPGASFRIAGPDGDVLPEEHVGRLQLTAARVTAGYLDDPAANAEAFTADGWLDTGDLAFMSGGEITITGRAKDVLVVNGDKHYGHEIERAAAVEGVLAGHVAACGVPNAATGTEDLVVCFVAAPGADPAEVGTRLRAAVADRLRLPVAWVVAVAEEEFPRTSGGKVRRGALRERLIAGAPGEGGGGTALVAASVEGGDGNGLRGQGEAAASEAGGSSGDGEPHELPDPGTAGHGDDHPAGGARLIDPDASEDAGRDAERAALRSGDSGAPADPRSTYAPVTAHPHAPSLDGGAQPFAPRDARAGVTADAIAALVADLAGGPAEPDRPFHELGLGSVRLARLRTLLADLLGRDVPITSLYAHPTAARLAEHLNSADASDATVAVGRTAYTDGMGGGDSAPSIVDSSTEPAAAPDPVSHPAPPDRRVAVIGMAARFPGAADVAAFWANLLDGVDSVTAYTPGELAAAGFVPGPGLVGATGALADADRFDHRFFGVSAKEAAYTDPQQRLFLQCVHHALEHAGYAGPGGHGGRVGVYAGSGMNLYPHHTYLRNNLGAAVGGEPLDAIAAALGNQPDFLATRVAHRLDLTGPAVNVQTACSTSLVAVHTAVRALLAGEADIAVAGAAAVHVPQVTAYRHAEGSILSGSGRCRPFDAEADGTVGGNGVAAVVLKPYARAIADGDTIHGVILGSAVNNDGSGKVGFTAPSENGQAAVVAAALRDAGIAAGSVGYVETHGTGTPVGDPIEVAALARVYAPGTRLGSVKANIGHLDSCAGMAGLIKALLMLREGVVPPQINYTAPNPALGLDAAGFRIGVVREEWERTGGPRRAAVTALGVGGTNAHVILEEPPRGGMSSGAGAGRGSAGAGSSGVSHRSAPDAARYGVGATQGASTLSGGLDAQVGDGGTGGTCARPEPAASPETAHAVSFVLPLSAADPEALADLASAHRDRLRARPGTDPTGLADTAYTLALGRGHLRHRLAVTAGDPAGLAAELDRFLTGGTGPRLAQGEAASGASAAFTFTGQGARIGPVTALEATFPVFAEAFAEAASAAAEYGVDIHAALDGAFDGWTTDVAQPAITAVQCALIALWDAAGVRPAYVAGHSVGEFAALAAAGSLTAAEAVRLAAARGRLMQSLSPEGGMLAVLTDADGVARLCREVRGLDLAAANGSGRYTLGGPPEAITAAAELCAARGVAARRLPVRRAFHTALVDPVLDELGDVAATVAFRPVAIPFISGVDGRVRAPGWVPDAAYVRAQARAAVRFDLALDALAATGSPVVLELGSDAVLTGLGRRRDRATAWIASQRADTDPVEAVLRAAGGLYAAGADLAWSVFQRGRRVPLPLYPFRRHRHWIEPAANAPAAVEPPTAAPTEESRNVVLARVIEVTAELLGAEPGEIGPGDHFAELGADSLSLVNLTRRIGEEYGVRVTMREVFESLDTPAKLAAAVAERGGRPTEAALGEGTGAGTAAGARAGANAPTVPEPPAAPPVPVTAPTPGTAPARPAGAEGLEAIVHRQLDLMREQLRILGGGTALATAEPGTAEPESAPTAAQARTAPAQAEAVPAEPQPVAPAPGAPEPAARAVPAPPRTRPHQSSTVDPGGAPPAALDVSLYFFGDYPDGQAGAYRHILDAAEYADAHGFSGVWLPERHFHSFGGIFPNPSVLAAAIAARTERIRINSGSVVLPLHHPIRVAEEWSIVDNLSHGRVGIGVAPGWHADDFVFAPDAYGRHKEIMYEHLATVRELWAGRAVPARSGSGEDIEVRLYPRPVQAEPPFFTAIVGNPDSYRQAAANGLNVVTNLMTQDVATLAANIALYRSVRAEHGLDPDGGRVVVLVHAFLGPDDAEAKAAAFEPFCAYLRSSLSLLGQVANSLGMNIDVANTPEDDLRFLLERAYARYCAERALIGSPEAVAPTARALREAGADEIAAFVDFGMSAADVRAGLPHLDRLRRSLQAAETAPEPAPMSPGQRRLWTIDRLAPGGSGYNEGAAVRLDGPLDAAALHGALRRFAERHPVLRTVYAEHDGEPVQHILSTVDVAMPVEEHAAGDESAAVAEAMREESRRVFDLEHGPVSAFRLLRFGPEHHVLVCTFHHIAADGTSYGMFSAELGELYRAERDGDEPRLPVPGATYAELARERADRPVDPADLAYWRERLADPPAPLDLPTDLPRPTAPGDAGRSLFLALPEALSRRLDAYARANRSTLFPVLLAGLAAAAHRLTGREDLVLGGAVAGRDERSADVFGFFVETVPLRFDLRGAPSFRELTARTAALVGDALDHAAVPFDAIVRAANPPRRPGRGPLFDIGIEYSNTATFAFDLPGVTATRLPYGLDKAPADVTLYVSRDDTVRWHAEYRTDVYREADVRALFAAFEEVIAAAVEDPDAPLRADGPAPSTAPALTGPPPNGDGLTLHGLVDRAIAAHPERLAVACGGTRWSYRELGERTTAIAGALSAAGVEAGDLVAVCLERRPELIAAQLAAMRLGAAFLALDPQSPPDRLRRLVADSGARAVVGPDLGAKSTVDVDAPGAAVVPPPVPVVDPDSLAYCVYTSGSTGAPKAVMVPHRAVVNTVLWRAGATGLGPDDAVGHHLGLGFDANLAEIYPALAAGAALLIAPDGLRTDPVPLSGWWRDEGVTVATLPTALMEELLVRPLPAGHRLRCLVTGGSRLRRRPVWSAPIVINEYGPSENAIVTTAGVVEPEGTGAPGIGRPVDGNRLWILDPAGRPVPEGAEGELWVGGRGVALGYLHDPDGTAAAFRPDPSGEGLVYRTGDLVALRADGELEFRGRRDAQVSVNGNRVEPAEVAAALAALPGVEQATVVPVEERGETVLAAYVIGSPGLTGEALTAALSAVLPAYLVPGRWAFPAALPLGPNGKLDRERLPVATAPGGGAGWGAAPATELERAMLRIWREELDTEDVPVDASFFALGGDSLGTIRLANRVRDELGLELTAAQVFELRTIRALAAAVEGGPDDGAAGGTAAFRDAEDAHATVAFALPALTPAGVEDTAPLTFQQEQMRAAMEHRDDAASTQIALRADIAGPLDAAALEAALDAVVARHPALRTRITDTDPRRQEVLPHRPFTLPVEDVPPGEVDAWCVRLGREPFDLREPPLLRARLARTGGERWTLLLCLQHLVVDGWSVLNIVRETGAVYSGLVRGEPAALPEPATTYAAYAREQRSPEALAAAGTRLAYWRDALTGAPARLVHPVDRERADAASTAGDEYAFAFPANVVVRAEALAARAGTSVHPVLNAGFALLTSVLTGVDDIVLAGPYAHRDRRETEAVVGFFGSLLPARVDTGAERSFAELVAAVHEGFLAGMAHQPAPFPQILSAVDPDWRYGTAAPVATALLTVNPPVPALELAGVRTTVIDLALATARRDFTFLVAPEPGAITGAVEYSTDLYDRATIAAWCDAFIAAVDAGSAAPRTPVAELKARIARALGRVEG